MNAVQASLRTFWHSGRTPERVAYAVGALLFASGLFHVLVYAVDGGPWLGPVSWRKPITFGLSAGLTLITAAWVTSFLRIGGRLRAWLLGLFTYANVVEVFGITLQAWRGKASHFNEETPLDNLINTAGLAAGAGVLIFFVLACTTLNFLPRPMVGIAPALRLALRAGWVGLVGAVSFGVLMVITANSKLAAPGDDAAQQQAAYTSAGWLKPAHAITMHAILVLPALAWLASHLPWTESRRLRVLRWATAGYSLLAVGVIAQALLRVPPVDAPLWTNVPAVAGAAVFAGAGLRILAALLRGPAQPGLTHPRTPSASGPGRPARSSLDRQPTAA